MTVKSLALTLALCVTTTVSLAQGPQMGTWKLNEAHSKITGGPKNTTVVYTAAGDSIKVTTDGTGPDGKPVHTEWTGKLDGKDYPVTGDSTADTRSYVKVNDHTVTLSNKKGGKETMGGRVVVSPDGKTRTVTLTLTDASGKKVSSVSVYDKQ